MLSDDTFLNSVVCESSRSSIDASTDSAAISGWTFPIMDKIFVDFFTF